MSVFDPNKFRALFPEFSDTTKYPDATLESYWDIAIVFIMSSGSPCNFLSGKTYDLALYQMAAHLMVLARQRAASSPAGSQQGGFKTSATVDKVSVSYLAPPNESQWDWWLNQTPYGQMLLSLLDIASVGGTSVGGSAEKSGFRRIGGVFF